MTAPIHTELLDFIGAKAFAQTMQEGHAALPPYADEVLDLACNVIKLDPRVQLSMDPHQRDALHAKGVGLLQQGLATAGEAGIKNAVRKVYESVFHTLDLSKPPSFQASLNMDEVSKSTESLVMHIVTLCIVKELGVKYREVSLEKDLVGDFDADSLDLVELVLCMEEEFNMEISDEESQGLITVQALFDLAFKKVMERETERVAFLKKRHRLRLEKEA